MKLSREFIDVMIFFFFILIAVVGIIFIKTIRSEGMQCQTNPFVYGAKKTEQQTGAALQCSCNFPAGEFIAFDYDKEKISPRFQTRSDMLYRGENLSELFESLKNVSNE